MGDPSRGRDRELIKETRRWFALFREDPVFLIGIFLLPFENLWFAPSKGWGALAPIAFFGYCVLSPRQLLASVRRLRRLFLVLAVLLALSSLNYLAFPPDPAILLDVYRALFLGVCFLVALDIHFSGRRSDPGAALRVLFVAYLLSLFLGLVQFAAVKFGMDGLTDALIAMSKRSTLRRGRIHFSFTEPAFASMHVYGVLLPLALFLRGHRETWRLWVLIVLFIGAGVATGSSLRFLVDTLAVGGLALVVAAFRHRGALGLATGGVLLALLAGGVYLGSDRVQAVVADGVYADGSLASRYFRARASLIGYQQDRAAALLGHGISNIWVPFRAGYAQAREEYRSEYLHEVDQLEFRRPASLLSMPIRLLSELGIVGTLVVLALLFDRRRPFLFLLLLYVYLPFDSYAFYTVWIYLFFTRARPDLSFAPAGNAGVP